MVHASGSRFLKRPPWGCRKLLKKILKKWFEDLFLYMKFLCVKPLTRLWICQKNSRVKKYFLSFDRESRRRYPALGHLVFFNKKKIHIFRLMHIALFLIMFFLESYFFDKQSKFLDVRFYWNKKVKYRFI